MTEETKPEMDYVYNVDQLTSANAYFDVEIEGETVRLQLTARHNSSIRNIVDDTEKLIAAYAELRKAHPRAVPQFTAPVNNEPTRVPLDANGNEQPAVKVATAGRLSWEAKDGKTFFKVMDIVVAAGEKGTKYGVNVWPEALKAANLDVSDLNNLPDIHGWRVDYICNDKGYPQKVTRLLPPTK